LSRRKGGTQNLEAYQLYLQGVSGLNQNTKASLDAAGDYLEQAIKLDPSFGMAYSGLASVFAAKADDFLLAPQEGFERARQLAQQALKVSPDLAHAHSRLQYVHLTYDWDWVAAEAEGQRALAIDPTDPYTLQVAGILSATLGRWDDAVRQFRAALVRDPLDPYTIWHLGLTYYRAGRFAESEAMYRKLIELAPDFPWTYNYLSKTLLAQGKVDEALAVLQHEVDEGWHPAMLPVVLQAAGRQPEADEALQAQITRSDGVACFFVAQNYAYRGDHDLALQWLERAYKQKDVSLTEIVGEPLFKSMADDPRYKAFLRKMKLPESPPPASEPKARDASS